MKKHISISLVLLMILAMMAVLWTGCGPSDKTSLTTTTTTESTDESDKDAYTVTFDLNYEGAENSIEPQTVKAGEYATEPPEPIREDYSFEGWFTEPEMKNRFDFAATPVTSDITLYAGWSEAVYYIAGNFTGYEPKKPGFSLKTVDGEDGWYWIRVELTEEVRDAAYDGHYYKITNGTWDADGCWGADHYALQPAPESPTGGGLGSVYIYENCTLTVCFDSVNKIIYDDSMVQTFETPRIYGDFNTAMGRGSDWSTADDEALQLTDPDGDGIYTGLYKIPAYTGSNENGYSMAVVLSQRYYISEYGHGWGADEQYTFEGEPAGMGKISSLLPKEDAIYEFAYNSETHQTTVTELEPDQVVELPGPTVYGDFSSWIFEGGDSVLLEDEDGDGIYTGTLELPAYTGTDKGYMLAVALSKKLYDDEYGIRWGVEEQYTFEGEPAGMGGVSYLKPEKDTTYLLSYDSKTHVTTVEEK